MGFSTVVKSSCIFLLVGLIKNFRGVLFLRFVGMFPLSLTVNSSSPVEIFMRLACLNAVIFANIILLGSFFGTGKITRRLNSGSSSSASY